MGAAHEAIFAWSDEARIILCSRPTSHVRYGAVRSPADRPVVEPESTAHVRLTLPEDGWDRLAQQLGAPDDPMAVERAEQLVANGWELLGVQFDRGTWLFRRPTSIPAAEAIDDLN